VTSALVLTAGFGTRLDPLTRLVAKPAVPIAGQPLVERVLRWLAREGIRDVVLNLHYKPETIAAVVGDGTHLGLRVRYSWEFPILGSAGGPRHALPLLEGDPFVIVNGDTLCEIALAPLLAAQARHDADVVMGLVPNPAPDRYNGVVMDDEGRVQRFVPRGAAAGSMHFVGIQVARRAVFEALPDGVPAETVAGIYRDSIARGNARLFGCPVSGRFLDVGTPRDYLAAALAFAGGEGPVVESGAAVHPSAQLTRTVVWPDVRIGAGVVLDDCIAAGPVAIPDGYQARHRILIPSALARPEDPADRTADLASYPL
jgi:NDP-sugar pyrophosphorylase family protein